DEDVREEARAQINKRFTALNRVHRELSEVEKKIGSTPERYVNVRNRLQRETVRLKIRCSQELRAIPFQPVQWKHFHAMIEGTLELVGRIERELTHTHHKPAMTRELKQQIRQKEGEAGATARQMRHWLKAARHGEAEAGAAKSALVEANLRLVVSIAKKY